MPVKDIHAHFYKLVQEIEQDVADVQGWLSSRDIRFLAMAAAHPCAKGEILEIGAFRGKSSIVLAKALQLAKQTRIYSCDPLNCHHPPDHPASVVIRQEYDRNLARKGVSDRVKFHQLYSHELARIWSLPIRMLWLDGDHQFSAVRQDLRNFGRYLTDGAIVAMHDVLNEWDGVGRAFVECVLASPNFGQAGIHGNIAWAQYRSNAADTARFANQKKKLAARVRPLIPIQSAAQGRSLHGFTKIKFRYLRWRARPRALKPDVWLKKVA